MNPSFDSSGAPKTLYVGNLPHEATEDLIVVLFNQIGPVKVIGFNKYLKKNRSENVDIRFLGV